MNKLVSALFFRLRKNTSFWLLFCAMAVWGVYNAFSLSSTIDGKTCLDGRIFEFAPLMGLVAAIFISLFVGTEYSDGTIRNKIVVGHNRSLIYLSNLIVCAVGNVLIAISYLGTFFIVGIAKGGRVVCDIKILIPYIICGLLAVIAFTGIMVLIALCVKNKAGSAIICMLAALILLVTGSVVNQKLAEPKMYEHYVTVNESGVPTEVEKVPNPEYIDGTTRKVLEFINDTLPSCQALQLVDSFDDSGIIESNDSYHFDRIIASMAFSLLFAVIGIVVFGKKEFK